jgi:UDP-N-acetylmuramate--alanine ligase
LDDDGVKQILPELTKPHRTYGFSKDADLYADDLKTIPGGKQNYTLFYRETKNQRHEAFGEIELAVLGKHNVLNSLAAIGMSLSLGAPFTAAKTALRTFRHVKRRFDERFYSEERGLRVVDDYGHHPTEIRAVLATAKQTGHSRVVTLFQPHRYSRTQLCWNEFLTCFKDSDVLLMLPIYAASEDPLPGITSAKLIEALRAEKGQTLQIIEVHSLDEARDWVVKHHQDGDLILTLGAGSITKLGDQLAHALQDRD